MARRSESVMGWRKCASFALLCGGISGCSGENSTEATSDLPSIVDAETIVRPSLESVSTSGGTTGTLTGTPMPIGGNLAAGGGGSAAQGGTLGTTSGSSSTSEVPTPFLLLSELKIDPPGTDGNQEYIELVGEAGKSLDGYFLVVIEADSESNLGQVDRVVDLSRCTGAPCRLGENGLLLFVAADGVVTSGDEASRVEVLSALGRGALENGTGYAGIYRGGTLPPQGSDWDLDDDGQLDLPLGAVEQDGISWTDGGKGDALYSSVRLGPKPLAAAAFRCGMDRTSWRYGELRGDATSLVPELAKWSPNGLEDFLLSPGAANECPPLDPSTGGAGGGAGTGGTAGTHQAGAGGTTWVTSSHAGGALGLSSATRDPVVVRGSSAAEGGNTWWTTEPLGSRGAEGGRAGSPSVDVAGQSTRGGDSSQGEASSSRPSVPGGCAFRPILATHWQSWGAVLAMGAALCFLRGSRKPRVTAPIRRLPTDGRRTVLA
ncbi:MAG: hypothetical protein QM784_32640 [Polyangiaceae bacterium]